MEIIIKIDDEKAEEFFEGFLKQVPIPIDEETKEPLYTKKKWLKKWLRKRAFKVYKDGRKKILSEDAEKSFVFNVSKEEDEEVVKK